MNSNNYPTLTTSLQPHINNTVLILLPIFISLYFITMIYLFHLIMRNKTGNKKLLAPGIIVLIIFFVIYIYVLVVQTPQDTIEDRVEQKIIASNHWDTSLGCIDHYSKDKEPGVCLDVLTKDVDGYSSHNMKKIEVIGDHTEWAVQFKGSEVTIKRIK